MSAASNPHIETLFAASARDERSLQFDLDHEIFGYLAQQAVEKLLKALITAHGEQYKFTHDLESLIAQLISFGEQLPTLPISAKDFTEYALQARYDIGRPLSHRQRSDIRMAVAELREYVKLRVRAMQSPSSSTH